MKTFTALLVTSHRTSILPTRTAKIKKNSKPIPPFWLILNPPIIPTLWLASESPEPKREKWPPTVSKPSTHLFYFSEMKSSKKNQKLNLLIKRKLIVRKKIKKLFPLFTHAFELLLKTHNTAHNPTPQGLPQSPQLLLIWPWKWITWWCTK